MQFKSYLLSIIFCSFSLLQFAQPSNDNITNAIDVTSLFNVTPILANYSNIGATQDSTLGSCSGTNAHNVWFKFQAIDTTARFLVKTGGSNGTIKRLDVALFESNTNNQLACNKYIKDSSDVEVASPNLTVGNWYYVSVNNHKSNFRGSFTIQLTTDIGNDFFEGAIDISSLINSCSSGEAYNNKKATLDRGIGSCSNSSGYNVWFKFQATNTEMTALVKRGVGLGDISRISAVLYENDGISEIACYKYDKDTSNIVLGAINLTVGSWYYLMIDNQGSGRKGTFTICLEDSVDNNFYLGAENISQFINSCSPNAAFTTYGTNFNHASGTCNNGGGYNRWFKFQATNNIMTVKLETGGSKGTLKQASVTLFESNGTTEIACNRYVNNSDNVYVTGINLTIGNWYYVAVDNRSSNNRGSFTMCLSTDATYDYYQGAEDISSYLNSCTPSAAYSTKGATYDHASGSCNNGDGYNRWFKFQATSTITTITVDIDGTQGSLKRASATLFEADGITEIACNRYVNNSDDVQLTGTSLVIGNWYYIAVDNKSSNNRGTFTMCLSDQPTYDYYQGAIDISSLIGSCSSNQAYTTVGATMDKSPSSCNTNGGYNRWFKFQAQASQAYFKIDIGGNKGTMTRAHGAIWDDTGNNLISCNTYHNNTEDVELQAKNLTVGNWYYVSVDNSNASSRGTFTLCMDTILTNDFYEYAEDITTYMNSCTPDAAYSTLGATMDKGHGNCSNASGYNRWFKFQASTNYITALIQTGGTKGTITRLNANLWQANGSSQLACQRYVSATDNLELSYANLTPGDWYYISVDNNGINNRGSFTICLEDNPGYDFYSGAIELTNLNNWCSPNAEYTTVGATMDNNHGSCSNASGFNRWFKFQALQSSATISAKTGGVEGSASRLSLVLWDSTGLSELGCARYTNNDDDLTISVNNLVAGKWYYISVDNFSSSRRGSFTLCVDNVSSNYYSRANGNWSSTNTWSLTNPATVAAPSTPTQSDVVYIDGHNITVNSNQSCAGLFINPEISNSQLTIDAAKLDVKGSVTISNTAFNNSIVLELINSGELDINNNLEISKSGGSGSIDFIANNTTVNLNGDLLTNVNGGSSNNVQITVNSTNMNIGGATLINHTTGPKTMMQLNGTSIVTIHDNLSLLATAVNKVEIELNNTSQLILNGDFIRGAPAHGKITCKNNTTVEISGLLSGLQIPSNNANTTDAIVYQNLVLNPISSATEYTLSADIEIQGSLQLINGKIYIPANLSLTTDGAIVNNSTITIEKGGALVQTHSGINANSGSGSYLIKQNGVNSNISYNVWSSPVQNATIPNTFTSANPCDIYVFDGQSQSWLYDYPAGYSTNCNGNAVTFTHAHVINGGDNIMNAGVGYFAPGNTVSLRSFNGEVNNGDITVPIYTTNVGSNMNWNDDDWNLVGNPYPSGLNAHKFWNENAVNNNRITDAIYFWDDNSTGTGYNQYADYATWNKLGGVQSGNSNVVPSGNIGVGQGFWVSAAANTNLVFNNDMRQTENTEFFKAQNEENHNVWITMTSAAGYKNSILIGFNNQTTDSLDAGFDAHKLAGNVNIKLAAMMNNEEFSILGIKALSFNSQKEIPITVFSNITGPHLFKESLRANLSEQYTVYLKDYQTNNLYPISNDSIYVQLQAGITYTQRFSLVFKHTISNTDSGQIIDTPKDSTSTNIEELSLDLIEYIANSEKLVITNNSFEKCWVTIYNLNGQLLEQIVISPNTNMVISKWNGLSKGVYLMKLNLADNKKVTHKIVK